jgi:hypothetical protein
LQKFIQTVKCQNNFWGQNAFLTCSWRFLISNELEQLEFKLEKIIQKKGHLALGILVNFVIQELNFCQIAQPFCMSVSLVRENLRGLKEILKHKIPPKANSMTERIGYPEYITNDTRLEGEYTNVSQRKSRSKMGPTAHSIVHSGTIVPTTDRETDESWDIFII